MKYEEEILIKHIPKEVTDLLEEMETKSKGYDIYLGGGFLRDLYVAVTQDKEFSPKDIDLLFVNNRDSQQNLPVLPRTYINYSLDENELPEDSVERGISSVTGLFIPKLTITKDVQIIVYNTEHKFSIIELAEDMDCNCNQIMYNHKKGLIYASEEFFKSHTNMEIRLLKEFDEERMKERLLRMQKRLPAYEVKTSLIIVEEDIVIFERKPVRGGSLT